MTNIFKVNKEKLQQRNLLLLLCLVLLASNLVLALKIFTSSREIVIVPFARNEFVIGGKVDEGYLSEMSDLFLGNLLNLTVNNIPLKKRNLLKYVTPGSWRNMDLYFSDLLEKYKGFNLATFFVRKTLKVDPKTLEVIAKGILTLRYGSSGIKEEERCYRLTFEFSYGKLLLAGFKEIKEEK